MTSVKTDKNKEIKGWQRTMSRVKTSVELLTRPEFNKGD